MAERATPARRAGATHQRAFLVVGAVLVTTFLVLATGHIPVGDHGRALDAFGYVLLVVAGGSLVLAGRRPLTVTGVITVALCAYVARRYPGGPIFVTGWIALFSLSWRTNRRTAFIAAAVLSGGLSLVTAIVRGHPPLLHLVFAGWSAAAVFLGDALRNRRSYLSELEERARHLEHTREEEARRRVAEERLRIARDLHDSVAHAMATISVQAGAAAHVIDRRPEAAKDALAAIQRASGDVLDELEALLGLLRDEGEAADRAPTPGIEQLDELVTGARDARLPVTLVVDGALADVPRPVGTAAYRIVQESLTNVMRHGGSAPTTVTARVVGDGSLTVEVVDAGPGGNGSSTGGGAGVGVKGMRERAESTGGHLDAGPLPDGGFRVSAMWPGRT